MWLPTSQSPLPQSQTATPPLLSRPLTTPLNVLRCLASSCHRPLTLHDSSRPPSIMSIGTDSQSSSQHLSSSVSSLNQSSKRTSSEISKIYKHASQLFLTRRLLEAYEALQPIVTPPETGRPADSPAQAPVATASTSQRIKLWSLYVTLLNSIVSLSPEEGKELFGQTEYRSMVRKVQSGSIWDQIVKDGYQGREDSVDAEVVYNLFVRLLESWGFSTDTYSGPPYSSARRLTKSSINRASKHTCPPRTPTWIYLPSSVTP